LHPRETVVNDFYSDSILIHRDVIAKANAEKKQNPDADFSVSGFSF